MDHNDTLRPEDLQQFTGTEVWYRHPMYRAYLYTEGVQYVAEKGGAYWLIDDIIIYHNTIKDLQGEPFCVWKLRLNERGGASLTCEDGNRNHLFSTEITFTDFPLRSIELWCIDKVLILPTTNIKGR